MRQPEDHPHGLGVQHADARGFSRQRRRAGQDARRRRGDLHPAQSGGRTQLRRIRNHDGTALDGRPAGRSRRPDEGNGEASVHAAQFHQVLQGAKGRPPGLARRKGVGDRREQRGNRGPSCEEGGFPRHTDRHRGLLQEASVLACGDGSAAARAGADRAPARARGGQGHLRRLSRHHNIQLLRTQRTVLHAAGEGGRFPGPRQARSAFWT